MLERFDIKALFPSAWSPWSSKFTDDTDCMVNCKAMSCKKRRDCVYAGGEKAEDNK